MKIRAGSQSLWDDDKLKLSEMLSLWTPLCPIYLYPQKNLHINLSFPQIDQQGALMSLAPASVQNLELKAGQTEAKMI